MKSDTVVVWDPNGHFRDFPQFSLQGIADYFQQSAEIAEADGYEIITKTVMVFHPGVGEDGREADFEALVDILWPYDDYTLIVDEAASVQRLNWLHPKLELLTRSSAMNVGVIQTSHRITDFHPLCRNLYTDMFLFRTTQTRDLKRIGEEIDDELPAILPTLPQYNLVHYWLVSGGEERISIWDHPEWWFVEIGRGEKEDETVAQEPKGQQALMRPPGLTPQDEDPIAKQIGTSKS
jgi:hypothetical protein